MNLNRFLWIFGVLAGLGLAAPALADDTPPQAAGGLSLETVSQRFLEGLKAGARQVDFAAQLIGQFENVADAEGQLRRADVDHMRAADLAQRRSQQIGTLLAYDLDGDGRVHRREVEQLVVFQRDRRQPAAEQPPVANDPKLQATIDEVMLADLDQDLVVTFPEMLASAAAKKWRADGKAEVAGAMFVFDRDRDDQVTLAELRSGSAVLFALMDRDGDGVINSSEADALDRQLVQRQLRDNAREQLAACGVKVPPADRELVVFSLDQGYELPTVSVAGPEGLTNSVEMKIEPGTRPIAMVVAAREPTIWRFTGARERIAELIVLADIRDRREAAGVTGVAREKITFMAEAGCGLGSILAASGPGREAGMAVLFGRMPDHDLRFDQIFSVDLPSGANPEEIDLFDSTPPWVPFQVWRDAVWQGGARAIEMTPEEVVSPAKVEPYTFPPMMPGLLVLIKAGKVRVVAADEALTVGIMGRGKAVREGYFYEIVAPIDVFPPGLTTLKDKTFIMGKGMKLPTVDLRQACFLDGETGEMLNPQGLCPARIIQ